MPDSMLWDSQLIERYDLSGPRYTSYPTVPVFQESFSEADRQSAIRRSNTSQRPLSLYFHIPFCSTVCYYCACNKIITANRKRARPYLNKLFDEIALQANFFDQSRPVHQLHWGGGTPTYISDVEKTELMGVIGDHFNLLENDSGEYSIEIHPGDMSVSSIACLRKLGFNRLSMGIQDFDPVVQKAVNRFNSIAEVRALVNEARQQGFHSISMDLIYGLPHQTWQTFSQTLDEIIKMSPDRLSVFNYAHLPHLFKVQKQIDENTLPNAFEKLQIMERMIERLLESGYVFIGMDHFAKPEDDLAIAQSNKLLQRNFQGYSTHGHCDLVGFGVSSISAIDNVFTQNHKNIDAYQNALQLGKLPIARGVELSRDDLIRQYVIKQLICHFEVNLAEFEQKFEIPFKEYFPSELADLEPMSQDGVVEITDQFIRVTLAGRILIRRICMVFDAYLQQQKTEVRYSKII